MGVDWGGCWFVEEGGFEVGVVLEIAHTRRRELVYGLGVWGSGLGVFCGGHVV